jgi:hypothetical protein
MSRAFVGWLAAVGPCAARMDVCFLSGPHVQGVLNLRDNRESDGGTQLVPGFHRGFEGKCRWF